MYTLIFASIVLSSFIQNIFAYRILDREQLHNLFDAEKERFANTIVEMQFNQIYENVILNAQRGITELHFTILCCCPFLDQLPNSKTILQCVNGAIPDAYKPTIDIHNLRKIVLQKIKNVFIDSNITVWERTYHVRMEDKCMFYSLCWN